MEATLVTIQDRAYIANKGVDAYFFNQDKDQLIG